MNDTPFHIACEELKMLGVVLRKGQGEYRVNYRSGTAESEFVTDDLTDAIAHGREMAERVLNRPEPPLGPTGPSRSRRSRMNRHNRKLGARRSKRRTKVPTRFPP
jgi:hypothetical protein